jgi:hypothetical protein
MRFFGGEAPGSRASGSRALHAALIALLAVLISAFMLHATSAWAQTTDEAGEAEAAQSESPPGDEADTSESDEASGDEASKDEEASEDEGSKEDEGEDSSEADRQAKPAADDDEADFERTITIPDEDGDDAEAAPDIESIETLAQDDVMGEIALATDRDGDGEVDNIVIPRGDCEIRQGASIVLREDSQYGNGRGTFTDNQNVQITSNNNQIRIVGNNPNQQNEDINPRDASGGFQLEPGRTYEVVASSGIDCDDAGGGGGGNNCLSLVDLDNGGSAEIRGTGPVTGSVIIETADGTSNDFVNFRVLFATSNPTGTLHISLYSDDDVAIDRTIVGARRGVFETQIRLNTVYTLDVTPLNQGFAVLPEGGRGTGNDRCSSPGDLFPPIFGRDHDVIINVIERTGALPDTGGKDGEPLTTAANGARASTPAAVLFSALSIMGFTGLLFLRRRVMR